MTTPRVLLADDHELVRAAFEKLLAGECDVVGHVADGRTLVTAARDLKPDVIVLDIGMPALNGLEAGRLIKHALPNVKLIFLTMHEDADVAAEAFRAGASAYLLKRSAPSELLTAIRQVVHGRSYITPLVAGGVVASLQRNDASAPSKDLTSRQREILQLLAEGRSMKQIAVELNITARTVAFHKYRMMEHLRIKSTAELIQYAVRHHIV
jgi:DNA-binding NarL/FixJ family response regulator